MRSVVLGRSFMGHRVRHGWISTRQEDKNKLLPAETKRLTLALTMDERALILRKYFGAVFYNNFEDYRGLPFWIQ